MNKLLKKLAFCLSFVLIFSCFSFMPVNADESKIDDELKSIIEQESDTKKIDIVITFVNEDLFDKTGLSYSEISPAMKAFFYPRNIAFVETLPESVDVSYMSFYAPLIKKN